MQVPIGSEFEDALGMEERDLLLGGGFEPPPLGMDTDGVMEWMIEGIAQRHGYHAEDLLPQEAWQCTYRAVAITYYTMACLLQPGWNASCLSAHDSTDMGQAGADDVI